MMYQYLSIFISLLALWACGKKPPSSKLFHIRVTWLESPQSEAVVSWSSTNLGDNSRVEYYPQGSPLSGKIQQVTKQGIYAASFSRLESHNFFYHHAYLLNLKPDQIYNFRVITDDLVSEVYTFRTAPDQGSWSAIVGGDSRSQRRVRREMNELIHNLWLERPNILTLIHGGDYVADGTNWSHWDAWLRDHKLTYQKNHILPIIPTRGNHENIGALFDQVFGFPGEGKGYFRSNLPHTQLAILNTETSMAGDQKNWIQKNLTHEKTWSLVSYHRPAYPAVKNIPSNAKTLWVPLFEDAQVHVAFESDGHVYKRTAPIYQNKIDPEKGIIYVGEGGLGVRQRAPKKDRWYLQGGFAKSVHHVVLLSVSVNTIELEAINNKNEKFDFYRITQP